MASFVPIPAAGWKVESAILGPPVPTWRLRPGTQVSGPLVNRCRPIESVFYHCTKEGHNDSFGLLRSGPLQRSSGSGPEHSNWWPGKCKSFTESLLKGLATVVKAADGGHTNPSGRRLVLWSQADKGDLKKDEINKILAAECKNEFWTPQLCYLSMTGYVQNKADGNQDDLRVVTFVSHAFNIDLIQKELDKINPSPQFPTETIIIIGTCNKQHFETAISELTGTTPDLCKRPSPYVARLQTKENEPDKCWQDDKILKRNAWNLVTPVKANPPSNSKKRKFDER